MVLGVLTGIIEFNTHATDGDVNLGADLSLFFLKALTQEQRLTEQQAAVQQIIKQGDVGNRIREAIQEAGDRLSSNEIELERQINVTLGALSNVTIEQAGTKEQTGEL